MVDKAQNEHVLVVGIYVPCSTFVFGYCRFTILTTKSPKLIFAEKSPQIAINRENIIGGVGRKSL